MADLQEPMCGKDNKIGLVDLGLVDSMLLTRCLCSTSLKRSRLYGDVEAGVSPNFLVRNWPPAFKEWATIVYVFASPRLLNGEVVRDSIVVACGEGILHVGKAASVTTIRSSSIRRRRWMTRSCRDDVYTPR